MQCGAGGKDSGCTRQSTNRFVCLSILLVAGASSLYFPQDAEPDFVVEPRGGKWTQRERGAAIDAYRGRPVAGLAQDWTDGHWCRGSRSVIFSIKQYTATWCIALARIWCSMMAAWFEHWVRSEDEACDAYPDLDPLAHAPADIAAKLAELPRTHIVQVRFQKFYQLKPRRQA